MGRRGRAGRGLRKDWQILPHGEELAERRGRGKGGRRQAGRTWEEEESRSLPPTTTGVPGVRGGQPCPWGPRS